MQETKYYCEVCKREIKEYPPCGSQMSPYFEEAYEVKEMNDEVKKYHVHVKCMWELLKRMGVK